MTKKEIEKIVGHTIRKDTFMFVDRLRQGQSYDEIYECLNNNRMIFGIKKDMPLTSKTTCMKIIEKINKVQQKTEEDKDDWEDKRGIYAISIDDVIIYIGKTNNSFKKAHRTKIFSIKQIPDVPCACCGKKTIIANSLHTALDTITKPLSKLLKDGYFSDKIELKLSVENMYFFDKTTGMNIFYR